MMKLLRFVVVSLFFCSVLAGCNLEVKEKATDLEREIRISDVQKNNIENNN